MKIFHLKACGKCGGDLAFDQGDWLCLQCGKYYYVGLYRRQRPAPGRLSPVPQTHTETTEMKSVFKPKRLVPSGLSNGPAFPALFEMVSR